MLFFTATAGILTLFLSVWCFLMSRRPRFWRLWWMSNLRQIDINSTSAERRQQDSIFRGFVSVACVLSVIACVWTFYWTWSQWNEGRQAHAAAIKVNEGVTLRREKISRPAAEPKN